MSTRADVDRGAGEGLDPGGQPAGERGAAGGDADEDEVLEPGGATALGRAGRPLDHLVGDAVDDAADVGGGEQGAGRRLGAAGRLGRAGHQASFPASRDGSLKEWGGPGTY